MRSIVGKHFLAVFACAAGLMMVLPMPRAAAAGSDQGMVSGNGMSEVHVLPNLLRMQMDVAAEGKDLKEAMANLKAMESAAAPKLTAMGAAAGDVHWGDAGIAVNSDRQRQMEQMARAMRRTGKKLPASAIPPVKVSSTLKVEWPLTGQNNEELLTTANDIEAKVKAAALAASPTAGATNAEQAEEAEENEGRMSNDEPPPGTPVFLYVHKITEEERAKAMADAFGKAKDEAARLAKGAGAEMGHLQTLSGQASSEVDASEMYGNGDPSQRMLYMALQQQRSRGGSTDEVIGAQPGELSLQVVVGASFNLK